MKHLIRRTLGFLTFLVFAVSCTSEEPEISRDIVIINDEIVLSTRMMERNETITISSNSSGKKVKDLTLTLKAELIPPMVDGELLQATSISRGGDNLVVSYNLAGETYSGGIDLIDNKVKLKSQVQFNDADVNDVMVVDNDVFLVGGTSSLVSPAYVEKITIKKGLFSLDGNVRIGVGSFTATSITNTGAEVYVTSGNDETIGGGLYQFSKDLVQKNYRSIRDARWVIEADGVVFCLSGNPSNINIFDINLTPKGSFEHLAFSNAESKMTIDIDDDLMFLAGGKEGLLVYDLDGNLVAKHTFDDGSITNSVTAENGNVFISNGEGGVHVASYDQDGVAIIGKLALEANQSVNHILLRGNKLFVASGLGGVKMIEVK